MRTMEIETRSSGTVLVLSSQVLIASFASLSFCLFFWTLQLAPRENSSYQLPISTAQTNTSIRESCKQFETSRYALMEKTIRVILSADRL
jgi:hypothetical protein